MHRSRPFVVGLIALLLAGCQPVLGTLSVKEPLTLTVIERERDAFRACVPREGDCERFVTTERSKVLAPGEYASALDFDGGRSLRLTLSERGQRETVVRVGAPPESRLPTREGRFTLSKAATGQPFAVQGDVQTSYSYSDLRAGWEPCDYPAPRWFCYAGGKQRCVIRYVTVYGNRPVEYRYEHEVRSVVLDFHREGSAAPIAAFEGESSYARRIYHYRGFCDVFHGFY